MGNCPTMWRAMARMLRQFFDPHLSPVTAARADAKLTIRHVGNFYGARTPAPLYRALAELRATDEQALRDVVFELIGITDTAAALKGAEGLPAGLVSARAPVGYQE